MPKVEEYPSQEHTEVLMKLHDLFIVSVCVFIIVLCVLFGSYFARAGYSQDEFDEYFYYKNGSHGWFVETLDEFGRGIPSSQIIQPFKSEKDAVIALHLHLLNYPQDKYIFRIRFIENLRDGPYFKGSMPGERLAPETIHQIEIETGKQVWNGWTSKEVQQGPTHLRGPVK
jgi:hypothetical protein